MGLFNEFDEVSHQQWTEKIIKDLKGKDFNENLVWNSIEGIAVQPFYNNESIKDNKSKTYHFNSSNTDIENRVVIAIDSISKANGKALYALSRGVNSIQFVNKIASQRDFDTLLANIDISIISLHFYNPNPNQTLDFLTNYCKNNNIKLSNLSGSISYDYLGELLIRGDWNKNEKIDVEDLYKITNTNLSLKTISVNGLYYNNAGATSVQELAYTFSQAVEYLNYLTEKKLDIKNIASSFAFNFGIGSNYFFEIAKIRAAKILWNLILKAYNIDSTHIYINSTSTYSNFACFDQHNNILRTTTEAMSAIIGGSNSINLLPFDEILDTSTNLSDRIAINITHILKEEAFFDKVQDASKGSYYIESLTDELVEESMELFKQIEQSGGFLANIKNGFIQDSIHQVAKQKQEKYNNLEYMLLGVNKYKSNEIINKNLFKNQKIVHKKGLVKNLEKVRFAQEFEAKELFKNV